jgi:hypothetical protein
VWRESTKCRLFVAWMLPQGFPGPIVVKVAL